MSQSKLKRFFYAAVMPIAFGVNLGLGLWILSYLDPGDWLSRVEIGTGAFCCVVAGIIAASAWSRTYWGRAMAKQVEVWRQMVDAIFGWIEDAPVPAESLRRLQRSLDEVVPASDPG